MSGGDTATPQWCSCQRTIWVSSTVEVVPGEPPPAPARRDVRDSRCWDVVTGLCGRCGHKYRRPGGGLFVAEPAGVVTHANLDPTELSTPDTTEEVPK